MSIYIPRVSIEAEATGTGRESDSGGVDGGAVSIYPESVSRLRRLADRVVGVDGGTPALNVTPAIYQCFMSVHSKVIVCVTSNNKVFVAAAASSPVPPTHGQLPSGTTTSPPPHPPPPPPPPILQVPEDPAAGIQLFQSMRCGFSSPPPTPPHSPFPASTNLYTPTLPPLSLCPLPPQLSS